ncbi:hypothetical protein Tco_0185873 [Tanacetum coccineum]
MGYYWICYLYSICYDMTTMIAVGMLFILLAFRYCDQHLQIEESYETSETRVTSPHSTTPPANPISPPSPQRPSLTQTSPTPTPPRAFYYRDGTITSYKTPSSSSSLASSPTLPSRKRYQGTFELITDTETKSDESEDKGTDLEDEEAVSEGQQQQAVPAEDTAEDEPLGLGYKAARRRVLERAGDTVPSTYELGQSSRSTPDQQLETLTPNHARLPIRTTWEDLEDGTVYMDIECDIPPSPPVSLIFPSSVATPAPAAVLNEGVLRELGAQLELHRKAIHEEIHSQRFRLRNLERVQDETRITLGTERRPILAFEAWAGYTDAQRGDLW